MTSALTTQEFFDLLAESNLLNQEEIAKHRAELSLDTLENARSVAQELVRHRVLTRYQAERLLAGRARGFFYDHYEILEALGFGGMGRLYLAEDHKQHRAVALKVLNEKYRDDAGMLARLKLEAEAGQRLHHNRILKTNEFRDTGAVCYLAMEFIKGINLLELLCLKGPLPSAQASDFILQAAEGLAYAHSQGLIHRDVKPDNLIVDSRGNVKVLDFGLALIQDQSDNEFSLAMIFGHDRVGTTDYISPEQVLDCQKVDARTDIYSLGCTFYQLVSGHIPFPAETSKKKIAKRFKERPQRLKELVPGIDRKLEWIIFKMLAGRTDIRYQTMQEVIDDLRSFAKRGPVDFSFKEILSHRLESARQRGHLRDSSRSSRRAISSKLDTISATANEAENRQQHIKTGIKSDTAPSVSGDYRRHIPLESTDDLAGEVATGYQSSSRHAILVSEDGLQRIPLVGNSLKLGRSEESDIRLDRTGVSKNHAEFYREGDWWAIRDYNSSNGTIVNGSRIREQMLWPGDTIVIAGNYTYRILDPDAPDSDRGKRIRKWVMGTLLFLLLAAILGISYALLSG